MGTVHREDGFRFIIFSNDHPPPHVHAFNADGTVVIDLESAVAGVAAGMKQKDVARAKRILARHREMLLAEWRRRHG